MGTMGPDILDSDEASDAWATLVADLVDEVREPLEADIETEDIEGTLAIVHALAILGTHGRKLHLARADAEAWRDAVLAAYDTQIDDLEPSARYRVERREALVDLFGRLAAACRDAAGPSAGRR